MISVVVIMFTFLIQHNSCARILAIVPVPSYSHQLFFRPIWRELSKRGHELTLLTTDPISDPPASIRQIDWSFAYELRHNKHNITKVVQENEYNLPKILASYHAMLDEIVDQELAHPDVQVLLKNDSEHFDLLMVEYHHPVLYAFSERFKCPYICISSMEIANYYHKTLGNPIHPALYPEIYLPFETDLSFKERLLSTVYVLHDLLSKVSRANGDEEEMAKKYFGENLPPLRDIVRNVSMVFLNTHPVFNVRPLGPGFISIGGGTHLETPKPLPKDLKKFLDNASEGVIYFSMGTNVRSHHLSGNFIKAAVDAFRELPYTVLWKFETDVNGKSSNVKNVKWVPQQDVLRHKNVKLFITQCGIQSMEESILSNVPLIAIPFVSDQKMNSIKIVKKGIGLAIDKNTITKDILKQAILEIMNNSSYRDTVKEISDLIRDQPMSGLDKAIWWTEYVLRHKGVKHFWHPNVDLPTYQFLLLDVISFLATILIIIVYIFYRSMKIVLNALLFHRDIRNKQKIN